jgi:hypothetical protein
MSPVMAGAAALRYARGMTRGNQLKWVVVVALALVLVGLSIFPRREPEERTENALRPPVSTLDTPAAAENQASPAAAATQPAATTGAPSTAAAKRAQRPLDARAAARRQRVLDALAHGAAPNAAVLPGAAGAAGSGTRVYKEGTMADKVGDFGEEVGVLNRELLPLVGECYDQAHERNPRLTGMLALSVSFAHAEGVGGIIESVEPGPGNQLHDDELLECVRQSAYSIELPEPKSHGRNARFLTIPFGAAPTEDAGAAKAP